MLYGLYASAAGAMASSYRQDVIANNLANADTVAFKRDLALTMVRRTEAQQNGSRRSSSAMLENLGKQELQRLVITGDLTNLSLESEFSKVARVLATSPIPVTTIRFFLSIVDLFY